MAVFAVPGGRVCRALGPSGAGRATCSVQRGATRGGEGSQHLWGCLTLRWESCTQSFIHSFIPPVGTARANAPRGEEAAELGRRRGRRELRLPTKGTTICRRLLTM